MADRNHAYENDVNTFTRIPQMVENCLVVELAMCRVLTHFGMIIWKAFLHCECFSFLSPDPFVILKSYPTCRPTTHHINTLTVQIPEWATRSLLSQNNRLSWLVIQHTHTPFTVAGTARRCKRHQGWDSVAMVRPALLSAAAAVAATDDGVLLSAVETVTLAVACECLWLVTSLWGG